MTGQRSPERRPDERYYVVRNHPGGGFTVVDAYARDVDANGDEVIRDATARDRQFDYPYAAWLWAASRKSRFGVTIHDEARDAMRNWDGSPF